MGVGDGPARAGAVDAALARVAARSIGRDALRRERDPYEAQACGGTEDGRRSRDGGRGSVSDQAFTRPRSRETRAGTATARRRRPSTRSSAFSTPLVEPPPVAAPPTGTRVIWPVVSLPECFEVELLPERSTVDPSPRELLPDESPSPEPPVPRSLLGLGVGRWLGAGVACGPGVSSGVSVGVEDGVGFAEGPGVADGVGPADGVIVGAGVGAVMLFVTLASQITVAPPPFPEPLHWLTATLRNEVVVEPEPTVHLTRCVPPPPLPEPLHCVTVAPVVLAGNGLHAVVGAVPPPSPDALHWLVVAAVGVTRPVTLFTTSTLHVTVPPPPFPEPLHWSIVVTSAPELVVEELQVIVAGALAAPWHSVSSTVEVVTPSSTLFVTL